MSQSSATDTWKTPEERELGKKLAELATLEAELAERELELTTFQGELRAFEARYLGIVGVRYAELDELEAQIAEVQARMNPKDHKAEEQAAQARAQAQESAQAVSDSQEPQQMPKFTPSEHLKKLYRDIAKSIHPDLAADEQERLRREQLMAQANDAYKEGNAARLQAISREWESAPETVRGEGVSVELVRTIRKIAQVEVRLRVIAAEIAQLKQSDIYQLKTKVDAVERHEQNLLEEMAMQIDKKIAAARECLTTLILSRAAK